MSEQVVVNISNDCGSIPLTRRECKMLEIYTIYNVGDDWRRVGHWLFVHSLEQLFSNQDEFDELRNITELNVEEDVFRELMSLLMSH